MKFCTKCGAKLEIGKDSCPQCGYDLSFRENKINKTNENNNHFTSDSKYKKNSLVISMKSKMSIIGIGIIAVLLIASFMVGNSLTKSSKVLEKFEKAVASGNKGDLVNILYCDDNRMEINEKSVSVLLNYFKDNPSYLNTVIKDLNKDVVKLGETNNLSGMDKNDYQGILSFKYTGKKFIFFPSYKIAIKPSFIQVSTSIKDVVISLNDKEIGKSDSDKYSKEFGPFMPGKYKVLASYKGKYTSLSDPHDVDLITSSNGKVNVEMLTNLNYIKVKSDHPEAQLFVNGKDTGVKIMDAQNFGPLNSDTKVYATVLNNGKTLKSNEYTVKQGDTDTYLSFSESENMIKNVESQLHDLIYWYTYYFTQAVNTNNFSTVEYYIYPGSDLYNEQKTYIPSTYSKGIKERILSFNITSYKLNEDNKSGTIVTEEIYDIESGGKTSTKTFKCTYTFKYNESKRSYQLQSISN